MRAASSRIWLSITSSNNQSSGTIVQPQNQNRTGENQQAANSTADAGSSDHLATTACWKHELVFGYSELVRDRVRMGWSCHLLTIMFPQFPGSSSVIVGRMKDQVQRVYSTLLTWVIRRPASASADELPILIGSIDLPVLKHNRSSAPLVVCNDGLHFHAVLLIPPRSRLRTSLAEHFSQQHDRYTGSGRLIQRIHVKSIVQDHGRVVDYVLKTITNGKLSYDDAIVVLPRSRTELDPRAT